MKGNNILLLYVLAAWVWFGSNAGPTPSSQPDPMIIRQVVAKSENPVQKYVVGLNGQCMDVSGGDYSDGNKIILWPCKSNPDANQLWSLEVDRTIRSYGKCLSTNGYTPSNYVVIFKCMTPLPQASRWEVWDNRTIVNPRSGLVLTAVPGTSGTVVRLMPNTYSTSQAWLSTYSARPIRAYISVLKLCLQSAGEIIWLPPCSERVGNQKWFFYGDGSIRPYQDLTTCITTTGEKGSIVKSVTCNPNGSSGQRWYVKGDGSIWNLYYKQVLDVEKSVTVNGKIIIWPFHGEENQIWTIKEIDN